MYAAVCPALIVAEVDVPGAATREKSTPEVCRRTVWGEPLALSITFKVPLMFPAEDAEAEIWMAHEALGARLEPQLFV